jgi:hypothetical protein
LTQGTGITIVVSNVVTKRDITRLEAAAAAKGVLMNKAGGSSLVILAILLILLGVLLVSGLIAALLKFTGTVLIIVGVVVGVIGLWQMLTGKRGGRSY